MVTSERYLIKGCEFPDVPVAHSLLRISGLEGVSQTDELKEQPRWLVRSSSIRRVGVRPIHSSGKGSTG